MSHQLQLLAEFTTQRGPSGWTALQSSVSALTLNLSPQRAQLRGYMGEETAHKDI